MSNQVIKIKFTEIKYHQEQLNKVSGLYFFHIDRDLKYVGKSEDLWNRLFRGYLNEDTTQHCNRKLMQLVKSNPSEIEVIFMPMLKEELKEKESEIIQDWIPRFNKAENPRYEIRPIQRMIARIVNEDDCEWTYTDMKMHLFKKWRFEVSLERIDEALANKSWNLSRYCRTNPKREILMPKKKSA